MEKNFIITFFVMMFFLVAFFGITYFNIFQILKGFNIDKKISLFVSIGIIFSILLVYFLTNLFGEKLLIIKRIFNFSIGLIWIFFIVTLFFYLLNLFTKINIKYLSIIILIVGTIIIIFSMYNAYNIKIKNIEIGSSKIDKNYSFIQLSDIHIGSIDKSYLKKIVKLVNEKKVDFVVITGDLFDEKLSSNSLIELDKIKSKTYLVLGNHEFYVKNYQDMIDSFKSVEVIRNKKINFDNKSNLKIIGIDDNLNLTNELEKLEINKDDFNLLLYHRPAFVNSAKQNNIDLMLCGHTHNGQIWPFKYFVKLQFKYVYGLFNLDNLNLYVSSGTGFWGPQLRLGTDSEIVIFNLKKK